MRRCRAPWSQVAQLAADGPGRVRVQAEGVSSANCRMCCMCGLCPVGTGSPPPAIGPFCPFCPLETHPRGQRGERAPAAQSSPCCLLPGSGFPSMPWSNDLVLWCPVAFCHAGISMGLGLEAHLAVEAGCAEESLLGIGNVVRKFCGLRPDSGRHASQAQLLSHSLVPAVSRSPCPTCCSCLCLFASSGS